MISPRRLANLLGPSAFALAADMGASSIVYARPAEMPDLWEQIVVDVGGRRGEAVSASVWIDVCYGEIGARGLAEFQFVLETGSPGGPPPLPPPGSHILANRRDTLAWEQIVADICPARARAFAAQRGPQLLARTADVRAAVARYLELFGTRDWRELRMRLVERATPSEIQRAERIARTPPTIQVYGGFEFYRMIVLGILRYSEQVEGRQIVTDETNVWPAVDAFSKAEPDWSQWGLAWRIEILADRLLACYPDQMPSRLGE